MSQVGTAILYIYSIYIEREMLHLAIVETAAMNHMNDSIPNGQPNLKHGFMVTYSELNLQRGQFVGMCCIAHQWDWIV